MSISLDNTNMEHEKPSLVPTRLLSTYCSRHDVGRAGHRDARDSTCYRAQKPTARWTHTGMTGIRPHEGHKDGAIPSGRDLRESYREDEVTPGHLWGRPSSST